MTKMYIARGKIIRYNVYILERYKKYRNIEILKIKRGGTKGAGDKNDG